ncbi:isochorismate synthase [Sporosarcina sp. BI001-red]|uniref:isochorismate synthase n=1 Tax=Sporosarcina sp. BI001-red TaxID=2282866 RepID=UPI000E26B9BE|nr:isochorismate synthase [Sporosarcina sp. BI001-red]REB06372.1 isochorismate synthase [Sporosarcina sp. BI001-red]
MNRKLTDLPSREKPAAMPHVRFFTETIEAGGISPLSFFEAGAFIQDSHRFYWENASKTMTLVGIGHALTLTDEAGSDRFDTIESKWKHYCDALIKEDKDMDPVLFGGFSFDEKRSSTPSEWESFPNALFAVPTFQLKIENGKTLVAVNFISEESETVLQFEALRKQRDQLIHIAQVQETISTEKPALVLMKELRKEHYLKAVKQITEKIQTGEAEKVVIARKLALQFEQPILPVSALQSVSNEQRDSYNFGLENGSQFFFGATPERLIEIKDGQAFSACVAGSIKRGSSADEDQQLGKELLGDKKNREEHQYVVDMITGVFESLCASYTSSTRPKLMKVRDIQHLHTPVQGQLGEESSIFQFVKALHPTPALGGVPAPIAMELIRQEEDLDRGYYAAPVGWTDTSGNGEFAVAIRSALLEQENAWLYAGGGIVADSDPTEEYEETWVKFRPMLRALGGSLNG